ncbi:2-amino-4-hydroxy-6-hydroxymethyldihydropteridine diphosphokinase [Siphonobacter sp. SORGH_AS_1065]|uniref:2-amino-4-hydroxy-6- hydroxymethyldihydropteridine diphosphokinase n=1 Tax=Siphonobacter sp. SORGH_AS_1065 TaxID=3041795 RepID=UPI0027854A52|nr:2-amino-4-hydroxy-6-hydroxymethyldihydropteridine diphosphokinase [Siphonobacter sp. SORGH_AS_1065]MDQ1087043.1 2-amino-4-hydroxy-6-hydroxymethyldihydropteridine diphosphokinase [Siphonobacter sp. SORGH_AS_1065]
MDIFLLLGANLGDRQETFRRAIELLSERVGTVALQSSLWETAAWGLTDQPNFLNQVLLLSTALQPLEVLAQTQAIEIEMGRVRKEKWGARLLDIDLLYYGSEILDLPQLKVPHPYIPERRFTLAPLAEIAPDFMHPSLSLTQQELLNQCVDNSVVNRI